MRSSCLLICYALAIDMVENICFATFWNVQLRIFFFTNDAQEPLSHYKTLLDFCVLTCTPRDQFVFRPKHSYLYQKYGIALLLNSLARYKPGAKITVDEQLFSTKVAAV